MEIEGKRVLITGAGRGLGRALCLALIRAGARELLAGTRQLDSLSSLSAEAGSNATCITPIKLDVTDDAQVEAATVHGRVDIIINNAGIAAYGGVLKGGLADIRNEIEVNYFGVLRVVRAFAPAMIERGDGLIVNIASILGKVSLPALGTYCATKAALLALTQSMRGDLAPHGVRAIAVLPGTIDTDMSRAFDGPKISAEDAAREIIDAIHREPTETAIGDQSRNVLAGLETDRQSIENAFARFRA